MHLRIYDYLRLYLRLILATSFRSATASKRNSDNDYVTHSLLTGEQDKSKFKSRASRPLRRMTISSPLNLGNISNTRSGMFVWHLPCVHVLSAMLAFLCFLIAEFDCSKVVLPEYRPLSSVSPNEHSEQDKRVSGEKELQLTFFMCLKVELGSFKHV